MYRGPRIILSSSGLIILSASRPAKRQSGPDSLHLDGPVGLHNFRGARSIGTAVLSLSRVHFVNSIYERIFVHSSQCFNYSNYSKWASYYRFILLYLKKNFQEEFNYLLFLMYAWFYFFSVLMIVYLIMYIFFFNFVI